MRLRLSSLYCPSRLASNRLKLACGGQIVGKGIGSDAFRKVMGAYPTGVTLVASVSEGKPVAMVIGSFVSVSLNPPLVGFLPGKSSNTWPLMEASGSFCVNVFSDQQEDLANSFYLKNSDPWSRIQYRSALSGSPILDGCLAYIDCEIAQIVDAGDHWFVLGEVKDADCENQGSPLIFLGGSYGRFEVMI